MSPESVEGMSTRRTHRPSGVPSSIQNSSIQRPSMRLPNWPSTGLPLGGNRLLLSRICSYAVLKESTFSRNILQGGCVIIPVMLEKSAMLKLLFKRGKL